MTETKVIKIFDDNLRSKYIVKGGDLDSDWAKSLKKNQKVWCEIIIYHTSPDYIYNYTGSVFPSAWPNLFKYLSSEEIEITQEGKELVKLANEKWILTHK